MPDSAPPPPVPSDDPSPKSVEPTDPETGKRAPTADMREKFARMSTEAPRDPEAERAFIESKLEMIRTHPTLSEEEKKAAIRELEQKIGREPEAR
jgi:hypothetical protein